LKADLREGKFFPEKFAPTKDMTLRAWIFRCLEGSTNRGVENERRYGRRWSLLLGQRLLTQITVDELRRIQAKMRTKMKKGKKKRVWADATINRHFAFLRHVLMVAVKDGKLTRNPVSSVKFFPEVKRTRFLTGEELDRLRGVMSSVDWKLVAFAVETGLRRSEQFKLQWNQVNLENGMVTLPLPRGDGRGMCRSVTGHRRFYGRSIPFFGRGGFFRA
jgi:integrase